MEGNEQGPNRIELEEHNWQVLDEDKLLSDGMVLRFDISGGPVDLFPLGLSHDDETSVSFVMNVTKDKLIDVWVGDKLSLEGMLPMFVFVDNLIQIRAPKSRSVVCGVYRGTEKIEGLVTKKGGSFISRTTDPKIFDVKTPGRSMLRIQCHTLSQLSIDFQDANGQIDSGIALDHVSDFDHVSDQDICYVNVYKDSYKGGIWQQNDRVKIGYFKYQVGKPYTLSIVVRQDKVLNVSCSTLGNVKVMRSSTVSCVPSKIIVRESYSRTAESGKFEVQVIG